MIRRPPRSTLFPTRRSSDLINVVWDLAPPDFSIMDYIIPNKPEAVDRKSTRLNSSHGYISYAVFCLKKKKKNYMMYIVRHHTPITVTSTDQPTREDSREQLP